METVEVQSLFEIAKDMNKSLMDKTNKEID